ncbi:hypothetical protein ILUMI_17525, partial [Ignelater luminosus]
MGFKLSCAKQRRVVQEDDEEDEQDESFNLWNKMFGTTAEPGEAANRDKCEIVFENRDEDLHNTEAAEKGDRMVNVVESQEAAVQATTTLAGNNKARENKREEPDRNWGKKELFVTVPDYNFPEGAAEDAFIGCKMPTDYFMKLFKPIMDNIILQSNLYAVQREG